MSSFEFVAVLFSVIIGLAISHLLAAVSDLVESSKRVKLYLITSIWIITVLIWDIFSWWGLWELQSLEFWNYPSFFLVVVNLSGLYLMTTLVLPQASESKNIDLRQHYYSVRKIFFLTMTWNFSCIVLVNKILFMKPIISPFTIMPFILIVLSFLGTLIESHKYHGFLSIFTLISLIIFMSLDVTIIK